MRRGFSLVEVVVALCLLSVGLLAAAATGNLAASWMRRAEAEQDAVTMASQVMDSLLAEADVASGELVAGRIALRWTAAGAGGLTRIDLAVTYPDGQALRTLEFATLQAPMPPALLPDSVAS